MSEPEGRERVGSQLSSPTPKMGGSLLHLLFIKVSLIIKTQNLTMSLFTHHKQAATTKDGKTCGNTKSVTYEMKNRLPDAEGNPYPTRVQYHLTYNKTANSNTKLTKLILKKVILPEMGMDMVAKMSPEKLRVLWDDFKGHSAA